MMDHNLPLASGRPRFATSELSSIAGTQGDLAAWRSLIAKEGPEAVRNVSGEFAVGFTDANGRGFLAVDRFAIRSLCYRVVGGELCFGERADELADASTEIDPQAIFDYFYFHVIPSPRTIFKGIYRLPPIGCRNSSNRPSRHLMTCVGNFANCCAMRWPGSWMAANQAAS